MSQIEIIDAEILPTASVAGKIEPQVQQLGPLYTSEQRAEALRILMSPLSDPVLGAGWDDDLSSSSSGSTSPPSSTEQTSIDEGEDITRTSSKSPSPWNPASFSDALLVRSCSQGWSLSFELTPHHPIPALTSPHEVLVRNVAVGLNPVDWKSVSYNFGIAGFPWVLGRDIAGEVIRVGAAVKDLKKGDRVWTCADSRDSRAGGYQNFSVHKAATVAKIPENVSDEQAATIGTGFVTAAVVLFWFFRLPLPRLADSKDKANVERPTKKRKVDSLAITSEETGSRPAKWILIYGGGAITGIYAAQLAHLSGLKVLSVASPSNFEYLTSLGVSACVDRNLEVSDILSQIRRITSDEGDGLAYAIDCVSSDTSGLCFQALASSGAEAEMVCLAGNPRSAFLESQDQAVKDRIKIHEISFSTTFYGDPAFATALLETATKLFGCDKLSPCRPEVLPDGLAGIRRGLEALRDGKAPRAKKLVIRTDETPAADVTHLGVRGELGWNGAI